MRRLGVYGENLATKKERAVTPSDFSIGGLYAMFNRRFNKPFRFRDSNEAELVLGPQTDPALYGWDVLNGFFSNLAGQQGSIIVVSYPGAGATQASYTHASILKFAAAYHGETEYGKAANKVGFTFIQGRAFSTKVTEATTTADVKVESTAGIKIGDMLAIGSTPVYQKVTDIDENLGVITLGAAVTVSVGDAVGVVAYQIKTFLKDVSGLSVEVEKVMGNRWLTLNSQDPDRYMAIAFKSNAYIDISVTGTVPDTPISNLTVTRFLSGGTDGTRPATVDDFKNIWPLMDNQPMRMVAAPETSNTDVQKALEAYCNNREDNPVVIITGQEAMLTKEQCIEAGQAFQRSNEVDAVYVHNWIGVNDPFSSSPTAPRRFIPPVGHVMGLWIQSIGLYGIHCIPARKVLSLSGVAEVEGYTAENDYDRTDLAEAGINVIQFIPGRGATVRNFFTSSVSVEFRYANALIMRNYVKSSVVESLEESENQPNTIERVEEDRMAAYQFMHKMWLRGSNGSVPTGETFGQYMKENGQYSMETEAYEVIADASNNPVSVLQAGNRNIDIYFMFPAPAGSIKVGVGLIYRVS
jgi:hypothetical protein